MQAGQLRWASDLFGSEVAGVLPPLLCSPLSLEGVVVCVEGSAVAGGGGG